MSPCFLLFSPPPLLTRTQPSIKMCTLTTSRFFRVAHGRSKDPTHTNKINFLRFSISSFVSGTDDDVVYMTNNIAIISANLASRFKNSSSLCLQANTFYMKVNVTGTGTTKQGNPNFRSVSFFVWSGL